MEEQERRIAEWSTAALDLVRDNEAVFTWEQAIRLVSALLDRPASHAECALGALLASGRIRLRRGRVILSDGPRAPRALR